MNNLIKTTVTVPEEIINLAKLKALQEKTTLSAIIRSALEEKVGMKKQKNVEDPMKLLGKLSLETDKLFGKRSDLYHERTNLKTDKTK